MTYHCNFLVLQLHIGPWVKLLLKIIGLDLQKVQYHSYP